MGDSKARPGIAGERAIVYSLVVLAFLIPGLFVFLFEILKHQVFETVPPWGTSLITDLFIGFAAALPALFIAHKAIAFIRRLESGEEKEKQAESKLQASNRLYQRIFDNSSMGIYQTIPEGRYLTVNPALAKMLGYNSPGELISSVTDIGKQVYADPAQRKSIMEQATNIGSVTLETVLRRKDGSTLWALNSVSAVYDDHHRFLYFEGFVLDITDSKQAANA